MEDMPYASWEKRFWAWLIDILVVGLFAATLEGALWDLGFLEYQVRGITFSPDFGSLALFIYWTVLEGYRGQSIGKMAMNLAVVRKDCTKIGYTAAAIESFGKAFILPLDCLVGWLAMPGSGQRLFNRVSDTVVVTTAPECRR